MARKLIVEIVGDASKLDKSFRQAEKSTKGFSTSVGKLGVGFGTLVKGTLIVEGVATAMRGLGSALSASYQEWKEQTQVAAQTGAVLKSTGGIAGVTAEHIDELAGKLSDLAGVDDEMVQSGENLLLTFTNLRNVAGEGNDIFDQATKATLDLSTAMKIDMRAAALQVGKALNDPARGLSRLQRIGVAFTQAQKDQVQALVASGKTMEAQRVILAELNREFGGSAEAAGKTLPGQLNRLRETFRNLGGELLGTVAPALASVFGSLAGFLRQLQEAEGVRAKLRIVWEGIQTIARDLYNAVRAGVQAGVDLIRRTDWGALLHRVGSAIARGLRSVDWVAVVTVAGQALGRAIVRIADFLRAGISRVNWQQVGRYLTRGIEIAVGALIKFLDSVNWAAVIKAIAQLLIAAIRAQQNLYVGIGKELVRLIGRGISAGIDALGDWLVGQGLKIALAFIEPFTHLRFGGGWARDLKDQWNAMLATMAEDGRKGGEAAAAAVGEGLKSGTRALAQTTAPTSATDLLGAGGAEAPDALGTGGAAAGAAAVKARNEKFDARIQRYLGFLQDAPLREQLRRLKVIGDLITQRIAATKSVTRKLELEDQLLDVVRQRNQVTQQLNQAMLDQLAFNVDKAGATKALQDDIAALRRYEAGIKAVIKAEGSTIARERELFDARQRRIQLQRDARRQAAEDAKTAAAAAKDAAQAAQFRALGLTGTGEERVPTAKALKKQLGKLSDAIEGTALDTKAWARFVANVRKVLSGKFGALGREVRNQIEQMLDEWARALEGAGKARRRPAGIPMDTSWGRGFNPVFGATSSVAPAVAPAGYMPDRPGINITNLNLHGVQDVRQLENELIQRSNSRPQPRRGP